MEKSLYRSPIGIIEIVCDKGALVSLKLADRVGISKKDTTFISGIKHQLDEYFSGKRKNFDIRVSPVGTDFQKLVWLELQKIPYGKTKSYSEIAEMVGSKNAQRAVGSACNKNPIMIIIPCHRVISKNGHMGGFAYGDDIKRELLSIEARAY